jgi:hypothetical protein
VVEVGVEVVNGSTDMPDEILGAQALDRRGEGREDEAPESKQVGPDGGPLAVRPAPPVRVVQLAQDDA